MIFFMIFRHVMQFQIVGRGVRVFSVSIVNNFKSAKNRSPPYKYQQKNHRLQEFWAELTAQFALRSLWRTGLTGLSV